MKRPDATQVRREDLTDTEWQRVSQLFSKIRELKAVLRGKP